MDVWKTPATEGQPRRCVITGGAGFIGSHLAEHLLELGHEVVLVDDLSTGNDRHVAHLLGPRCHLLSMDGQAALQGELHGCRYDWLFHLAAVVGVDRVLKYPALTVESNLRLSQAALQAASASGACLLMASSSEVYGADHSGPLREDMPLTLSHPHHARWGYALSKAVDEFLLVQQVQAGVCKGVAARFFNTVGPRQSARHGMVLPRLIHEALTNQPLTLYGDGEQVRCFCDVRDVVRMLVALVQTPAAMGQVVNVGSDRPVTMNQLADLIAAAVGRPLERHHLPYTAVPGRADEPRRRVPDLGKLHGLTGIRHGIALEQTIVDLLEYCRSTALTGP